jgi:hypothetical protein
VGEVLGHDEQRAWLLLADAGTPIGVFGNLPETWLVALPLYAELQVGEAAHAREHLTHFVPDLRVATLPARYEDLLQHELPLESDEIAHLLTAGSRGCATRIWSRGDAVSQARSPSRSAWARSRTRSRGAAAGRTAGGGARRLRQGFAIVLRRAVAESFPSR